MKKRIIACLFITVLLFTSCSYSQTGIDSLISPPKLSDQQNEIYNALIASVGKNIKLKYPRLGDFTSAFLITNIDDEPTQEAIVFYENTNNASATIPLRINVLDQEDGKWVSKNEIGVEANEVEKVSFITEDKKTYMAIGFNLLSKAEKTVSLYTYDNGMLNQQFTTNCFNYEVFDIDNDKSNEIITFVSKPLEGDVKTMTAYMYRINSGGARIVSETPMDPNVTEYAKIQKGKLPDTRFALYLDGLKGTNNLCTEILSYVEGNLKNLIYDVKPENNLISKTARAYGSLCMDLNKDGTLEIPTITPALGYENMEQHQQLFFTNWYNYTDKDLKLARTTFAAYSLGYLFTIPQRWIDKVTIEYISSASEIIFYDFEHKDTYDSKLLSIKVVKRSEYVKNAKDKGYSLLVDNGQLLYTYKLYDTTSAIKPRDKEVKNCFQLL